MGEPSEVLVPLFGVLDITKEVLTIWGMMAVLLLLAFIGTRHLRERPGVLQNMLETGLEKLESFFSGILGRTMADRYYAFLATLFIFIIFSNYLGLLPGAGSLFSVPTSKLSVTLALGLLTFVMIFYCGFRSHGVRYMKHYLKPVFVMLPFIIIDEIVRPVSLALRLYGNVFGEESVTEQLYELLPIGAPLIMMVLSLLFCAIQAVVFVMLSCIYLSEAAEEL